MNTSTYQSESSGITDWKKSIGRVIRTDGCVFLLCTGGRATVSANMQKMVFRKDDLAVLTSDVYFSVSEVSAGFSARYVALSEPMLEAAYYQRILVGLPPSCSYPEVVAGATRPRVGVVGTDGVDTDAS